MKRLTAKLLVKTRIYRLFTLRDHASSIVLMYHKVQPSSFDRQIRYLKKHYELVDAEKLETPTVRKKVHITFDDGYLNNYTCAYPILKKHSIKATIFLTSGYINGQVIPWFDRIDYLLTRTRRQTIAYQGKKRTLTRQLKADIYSQAITMSARQREELIGELQKETKVKVPKTMPENYRFITWQDANKMKDVFALGAHTHTHPILPLEEKRTKEEEILNSRTHIMKHTGTTPTSFCYPNGNYDEETLAIVKKHFTRAFSVNTALYKSTTDPYMIPRIGINEQDDENTLALKLTTVYLLLKKRKENHKIILVTNYYLPVMGGITIVLKNLSEALVSKGACVKILAYPNVFRKIENLFSHRIRTLVHRTLVMAFITTSLAYIAAQKIATKNVIVHSHSANFCARLASLSRLVGARSIHTFHTTVNNMGLKRKKLHYLNTIGALTACSQTLAKETREYFSIRNDIMVIRNGIDTQFFNAKKTPSTALRVLTIGNLLDVKDPHLFVATIAELSRTMKVQATMIGTGPLKRSIEQDILQRGLEKVITLIPPMPNDRIRDYYEQTDIFLLTSTGEGMPMTVLEALSTGTPVVTTPAGGVIEVITQGKNGYIATTRSPQHIATLVRTAYKNRAQMGREARNTTRQLLDWSATADSYLRLYQQILKMRGLHLDRRN